MFSSTFPDPRDYDFPEWALYGEYFYKADDIVSFGEPLTVDNVREAYRKGIFPWYIEGVPLPWFCPAKRGSLELFGTARRPKSCERAAKGQFTFTIDRDFGAVITQLRSVKTRRPKGGTWITKILLVSITRLHEEGIVHSVEAWDANGELAGGLYGVDAGGVFCGESMFFLSQMRQSSRCFFDRPSAIVAARHGSTCKS